jgi:hypothetical protein
MGLASRAGGWVAAGPRIGADQPSMELLSGGPELLCGAADWQPATASNVPRAIIPAAWRHRGGKVFVETVMQITGRSRRASPRVNSQVDRRQMDFLKGIC